jgi:hypothetical protein
MPNKRDPNTINISFWADAELIESIDRASKKMRGMDRSQFIRDSIAEKLKSLGYEIDDEIVLPAPRTKKKASLLVIKGDNSGYVQNNTDQANIMHFGADGAPLKKANKGTKK